jgi:hypothetical protein
MQIETPVSDALYAKVTAYIKSSFNSDKMTQDDIRTLDNMLQLEEGKYAINRVLETLGLKPEDEPWIEYSSATLLNHVAQIQESLETLVEKVGLVPGDIYKDPLIAFDGISRRWDYVEDLVSELRSKI